MEFRFIKSISLIFSEFINHLSLWFKLYRKEVPYDFKRYC